MTGSGSEEYVRYRISRANETLDEIDIIEETRVRKVPPESRLSELLMKDSYNTITAKTHNVKIAHFKKSTRYKLEKALSGDRPNKHR